jgi:hypothetical protein
MPASAPGAVAALQTFASQEPPEASKQDGVPSAKEDTVKRTLAGFAKSQPNDVKTAYPNLLKMLHKISGDGGPRPGSLNTDVLERVLCGRTLFPLLECAGFADETTVWRCPAEGDGGALADVIKWVREAYLLSRDPTEITFSEVVEAVKQGETLPGIRTDFSDEVVPLAPTASTLKRPPKPWERAAATEHAPEGTPKAVRAPAVLAFRPPPRRPQVSRHEQYWVAFRTEQAAALADLALTEGTAAA